jgi:NADPH-dependent glutamate synthase beta subunit-like oxidoreductase
VLKAIDFLLNASLGYSVDLGAEVLVIGGGNVALDAARTALREVASDPAERAASEARRGAATRNYWAPWPVTTTPIVSIRMSRSSSSVWFLT